MMDISRDYQSRLRAGDPELVLPVIAYYGTGRLWDYHTEQIAEKIGLKEPRTKIVVYKTKNAYGGNEKWLSLQKGTGNYIGEKLSDGRNITWKN